MTDEDVARTSPQLQAASATSVTSALGDEINGLHLHIPSDPGLDRLSTDETSDDNGQTIDEHLDGANSIASNADASSIIGISIGQVQSVMKSPATPATRKAQVLQESLSYFAPEDNDQSHQYDEPVEDSSLQGDSTAEPKATDGTSTPKLSVKQDSSTSGDGKRHVKHNSIVESLLRSASTTNRSRQRSSSGSLWLDGIRKMLPSLPSITSLGYGDSEKSEQKETGDRTLGPAGPGTVRRDDTARDETQNLPKKEAARPKTATDTDLRPTSSDQARTENTMEELPSRPPPLRRVTSDQSLYIRRAPTGASQFDDYNNFADVSDMVNSRFKAITDSFQDSALRIPKMPSISWGDRSSTDDSKFYNNTTYDNTKANTGLSRTETLAAARRGETTTTDNPTSSRHPVIKDALSQMRGDLVILGGYRGSVLREAQAPNRQLWVPVKVGLNLRKADLEVGLTREDELKMEETIIADGTLSHIGPVDICRRLIKKCRKCRTVKDGKLRVHDYGYDWRLSPDLLADRYIAFLESLPCNQKDVLPRDRGAWVIAHSLGGLINRNVINRRPELFAGIVYAGTPQNCVNILGPLRNGDDVLFSSRVLTAQVNFTLRTSYVLLPQDGRCFINKKTGERYDVDFFDVKSWDEYHLSPCIKAPLRRQKPDKRQSILGTGSESNSISSRYTSWFGTSTKNEAGADSSSSNKSPPQKVKDKAISAKDDIANTAETAAETNKFDSPFSPSLSDGQNQRPSVATTVTIPLPAATEYLSRTLSSVLSFKQSLAHNPDIQARNAYPPAAVLFAKNTPTVYGAFVESRDAIKYDDAFDELAFAAGDGVVLASASQLPNGYRCVRSGRVESERGHVGLLGDIEGVGKCLAAIIEARRRGVGSGAHDNR